MVTIDIVGAAISRPVKIVPIFTPQRGSMLQVSHFAMQNGRAAISRPYSIYEALNYNLKFFDKLQNPSRPGGIFP